LLSKRNVHRYPKALREVDELRKALASYDKDKQSLAHTKTRLLDSEKSLKNLEWEHEVSMQRFVKVEKERDELYNKFERAIFEVGVCASCMQRSLPTAPERAWFQP
jgi:hypothetical protein